MKTLIVLFCLGLSLNLFAQNPDGIKTDFEKLYFLNGTWNQTNIKKPGRSLTEKWTKSGDYEMKGQAVTLQNSDTVFVERITLTIKDNTIYYIADVPQNKQPILFKVTSLTNTSFTCENPEHDFPKKITYELTGIELKATISGNGKSIEYRYVKID